MNRLAVVEFFNDIVAKSLTHCVPIMEVLGGEYAVFYCRGEFLSQFPESVARLRAAAVEIVVDDFEKAGGHEFFLADFGTRGAARGASNAPDDNLDERGRLLKAIQNEGRRIIAYSHGSGHDLRPGMLQKGDMMLFLSEGVMFQSVADGVYYCDANNYPIIGVTGDGVEGVVAGLFHLEGQDELENLGKETLRKMLAEKMGVEFDPRLPLAVLFHRLTMEGKDTSKGLECLAEHANIIVKYYPGDYNDRENETPFRDFSWPVTAEHKNVFYTAETSFNALVKYAADICLIALPGGTLSSNVLAGIPSFPVHTSRMMAIAPYGSIYDYRVFLQNTRISSVLLAARHIRSVNILDTAALVGRISGPRWLQEYERQLPLIQQAVFGRYRKGRKAAEAAARYIKNALAYGTFADPEFNRRRRTFRGPVQRPETFQGTL